MRIVPCCLIVLITGFELVVILMTYKLESGIKEMTSKLESDSLDILTHIVCK